MKIPLAQVLFKGAAQARFQETPPVKAPIVPDSAAALEAAAEHRLGEDQVAGLEWMRTRISELPAWRPRRTSWIVILLAVVPVLVVWGWSRFKPSWRIGFRAPSRDRGIEPLIPLLRTAGRHVRPATGETARDWIQRLSRFSPDRAESLDAIADEVDAVAYGEKDPNPLKTQVKTEARVWKRMRRR